MQGPRVTTGFSRRAQHRRCPCGQRTWARGLETCPWHPLTRAGMRDREVGHPACTMLGGLGSLLPGPAPGLSVPFLSRRQGQTRVVSPNFQNWRVTEMGEGLPNGAPGSLQTQGPASSLPGPRSLLADLSRGSDSLSGHVPDISGLVFLAAYLLI